MTVQDQMFSKAKNSDGFIAALDQSGGSTPKALRLYGIEEEEYVGKDNSMYDSVHEMRSRIITNPSFEGSRILGAILFENTMDREVDGIPTSTFLWEIKNVIPFLKVDKGLDLEVNGVQLMKPIPDLDALLGRAKEKGIFGTKMRSFVKMANIVGIKAIVAQQFEIGLKIVKAGLVPIIEPEIDIKSPEKTQAEEMLKECLLENLDKLGPDEKVMLKLTLPSVNNLYRELTVHPNVIRVVALSGGYNRSEANKLLSTNNGVIGSFSRALTEGLKKQQSDEEFNELLDNSIASIFEASVGPE